MFTAINQTYIGSSLLLLLQYSLDRGKESMFSSSVMPSVFDSEYFVSPGSSAGTIQ